MPEEEAVVISPEGKEYDLGPLNPQERRELEHAVDVAAHEPVGAPPAGYGGASPNTGVDDDWLAAGGALLAVSGLASYAYWRRRRAG